MIHLANILIATNDPALGQELLNKIRRHGYDGRVVASQDAALATAQQEHPDIVLVGPTLAGGDAFSLAKALQNSPACSDIPVSLIAAGGSVEIRRQALDAGIDDVLAGPLEDVKLLARLRPLVRLATMQAELHQRARTARRFGIEVEERLPRDTTETDYPLLIVGETGDDLTGPLAQAKLSLAADPYQADDLLGRNNFDAAIIAPEENVAPYLDLCAQIRNNPRLFNLPVLIIGQPDRISEDVAYHHGASGFFLRPVDPVTLQSMVLSLVRRQRLRWAIRDALRNTLQTNSRDASTRVYNRDFLNAYLSDRLDFAKAHGRHLSIMFFRIPDVEGIRQRFGEEQADHLRLQLAQWITGLLRGEDLTARFEENEFCVVLPDTPKEEAEVVMHRIAGVLTYTDFAVKDVYEPVKVWVRVGSTDLQPDDDVEHLIARARHDIV
jgi:two-component system cell cycle response regulator